jgi:hypothetical protein
MAKKLGRNDKCHCGSGKKYKKCCMTKDQKQQREASAPPVSDEELLFEPESNTWQDEGTYVWGETAPEYFEEMNESLEVEKHSESRPDSYLLRLPNLSDEQNELVDDWLDHLDSIKDPKEKAESLKAFLRDHPELVPSVAAETFVFTDLQKPFLEKDRFPEYIDHILFLRENYPQGYVHVFGYLDRDIIAYLCMMGRTDEIDSYLDLFRTYPGHDPENLDDVFTFLMCQGLFEPAHQLAQDVVKQLGQDPVIDDQPLQILTMGCFAPLLDAAAQGEWTENTTRQFFQCIKPYRKHLPEKWFKPGYIEFLIRSILNYQDNRWTLEHCQTRHEVLERYNEMLLNFMGFLGRERNVPWAVADHFRLLLSDFFEALIPEGKVPTQAFPLTRNTMDKALKKLSSPVIGLHTSTFFGILSALNALADYLVMTGSIGEDMGRVVQGWAQHRYDGFFHASSVADPEILALNKYPL